MPDTEHGKSLQLQLEIARTLYFTKNPAVILLRFNRKYQTFSCLPILTPHSFIAAFNVPHVQTLAVISGECLQTTPQDEGLDGLARAYISLAATNHDDRCHKLLSADYHHQEELNYG